MIWPNDAKFAFAVSVDVDGDLPLLSEAPSNLDRLKSRSAGLYGPEDGAPRLLKVLNDVGIRSQWFVPGQIARRYPHLVCTVHDDGHLLGVHGNHHLDFDHITLEEQVEEMLAGRDALESAVGVRAYGFRTPAGEWADGFPETMERAGFRWSSSLPSDELPFQLTDSRLVEIPFRYELEDLQYLGYSLDPPFPPGQSRITPLESVEDNWWCEVRGAERYGTLVHLRLNAEVMGTPGRSRMLERFLTRVLTETKPWVATFDDLHALWAASPPDDEHPYRLFTRLIAEQP